MGSEGALSPEVWSSLCVLVAQWGVIHSLFIEPVDGFAVWPDS